MIEYRYGISVGDTIKFTLYGKDVSGYVCGFKDDSILMELINEHKRGWFISNNEKDMISEFNLTNVEKRRYWYILPEEILEHIPNNTFKIEL